MAGEWRERSLGELAEIYDGPHATPAKTAEGPVFLGISNLSQGRLVMAETEHLSEDDYARWTRRVEPRAGDVVFSYETRLGEAARIPDGLRCCLGRRMGLLRAREGEIDQRFLLYAYLGPQFQETLRERTIHGSTVDRIPLIDMPRFPILVPSDITEQRAIAHILGTLDDKIELNRRMSETLEAMARALFKSWFIDFDPVRRNAARARSQPSPQPSPKGRGSQRYRGGYDFTGLVETARELRRRQTPAEDLFWELVRDRRFMGLKFRRQHQLGDYIVDFYCHEHRLVIESDGGVHAGRARKDHKRDAWMQAQGFNVLRFSNEQLLNDPQSVLLPIADFVSPPPSGTRVGGQGAGSIEALPPLPLAEHRGAGSLEALPPLPLGEGQGEGVVEGTNLSPLPLGEGRGEGCVEAFDALFPARLVNSELGEIPEGWEMGTLADLSSLNPEVWTKETRPSKINYVDLSNTKWGRIEEVTTYAAKNAPSRAQRVLRSGDTIVGTVRPGNGSYALISEPGLTGSTGFAVLRPNEPAYMEFIYLAATAADNIDTLAHLADGAAYPAVRPDVIAATPIVRPDAELYDQFSGAVRPLLAKITQNERESRTLAQLRDTLLPKLISGELRVKEAERFLKERGL
jgi:very-short-patch-repair endonuclease/restriction endonuclease S subunit